MNLLELQKNIGYIFKDETKLIQALTHTSYANEHKNTESNERLEFLGDAILEFSISDYLYRKYPNMAEGDMTKKRAVIVCEKSLYILAMKYNIIQYIKLGNSEINNNSNKTAMLADSIEAIIGAIYLDSDILTAKKFINDTFKILINEHPNSFSDYKTMLQEKLQENGNVNIKYELVSQQGPDHDKIYTSCVKLSDKILGEGSGKSKKESEQMAAKEALEAGRK